MGCTAARAGTADGDDQTIGGEFFEVCGQLTERDEGRAGDVSIAAELLGRADIHDEHLFFGCHERRELLGTQSMFATRRGVQPITHSLQETHAAPLLLIPALLRQPGPVCRARFDRVTRRVVRCARPQSPDSWTRLLPYAATS